MKTFQFLRLMKRNASLLFIEPHAVLQKQHGLCYKMLFLRSAKRNFCVETREFVKKKLESGPRKPLILK